MTVARRPFGPTLEVLALNLLPGALAGVELAGLLFFLNPDLPFDAGSLIRAAAACTALAGLASVALLTPFNHGRPGKARRMLPWSLTAVLVAAALLHGFHASRYAYFLPPGINVRLIKAALILSLAAVVFFYTALLHTLRRRPYGRRSRLGLTALALAAVWAVGERREAFRPTPRAEPLPSAVTAGPPTSVLVVGLEGATLDAVLPLARQGRLPFFARLLDEGAHGRLESFAPVTSVAQWTTVATGRMPYQHGVIGRDVFAARFLPGRPPLRLRPELVGLGWWGSVLLERRELESRHRRAMTLWEIPARLGMPTGFIGWPATAPVPLDVAFAFSDEYFGENFVPGSAMPPELAERGRLFQVPVDEIDPALSAPFGDRVPLPLLNALAQDVWRMSLTDFLWDQRQDARARFVILPGLGEASRLYFGGYSAFQFEGSRQPGPQRAAESLTAYYRYLDGFLARSWDRLAGRRLLVVVSAYGFAAPDGAQALWRAATGRGLEGTVRGAPDGMLILSGDGIRAGTFLDVARLDDILPTLLYGLGFPIATDLGGTVLTSAFDGDFRARRPLTFVPSYETLALQPDEPPPG